MDKLIAMGVFCAVVETGSFAKASEKLGISTTSASRHVGDLEQALGVPLLHRSPRKISLTECGALYFERCWQHLDDIAATESAVAGDCAAVSGSLRLSVPYSLGNAFLAPRISRFTALYPKLKLEILFSDRFVDLAQEGIDVAVRISSTVSDMYVGKHLAVIRTALCASPAYVARAGMPRHPDDLASHNCLCYSNLATGNVWGLHKDEQKFAVSVHGNLRSNNGDMNRLAALDGHGIICEPTFIIGDDLRSGRLIHLLPDYRSNTTIARAMFQPAGRNSARIRALVNYLSQVFETEYATWDYGLGPKMSTGREAVPC